MSLHIPMHVSAENAAYRRFLRYYYLARFFYEFIFAYAIYTVYFSLRGMSVLDISLLLSWWSIAAMALEIPTGALADSWSRRKMLAVAPLIKALCFVTWFFAGGNFYLYALGFTWWALGSCFASGTLEALLYDGLVHYGHRGDYEQAVGRQRLWEYVAGAISGISGGLIAAYRLDWVMLASVAPLLLSAACALMIEETPRARSTAEVRYWEHIRLAIHEVRTNRVLLYLLVCLWGISIFGLIEEFDQLYYRLVGLPIATFGAAAVAWWSLRILGVAVAHRMKDRTAVLYCLPVCAAALLAAVGRWPSLPMIGVLLLAYAVAAPVQVLVEARIQRSIVGASRATVTSAISLLLGLPVLAPLFGLIAGRWRLPAIYLVSAMVLVATSAWTFGVRKRLTAEPSQS